MIRRLFSLLLLACLVSYAVAQNSSTLVNGTSSANESDSFPYDPILKLRPPFLRSLPVQVLINGVVLTLSSVLLIQLLFTAQYHWPLAPLNFCLQVSAVLLLLVTSAVTIEIMLSTVTTESRTWPYMLNYLAVDIPPSPNVNWPTGDLAAWLLMTATTAGLIQITHIQFLTLLFPSPLERRLIYALLGPLAVTSAVMQLLRVRQHHHSFSAISAVQNICNAALSMLFTAALFLWGMLVNRKNAWRMDGGTAAFGVGALLLAPTSSAIAMLYVVTKEQYSWMPQLMWAIILWQSFLGWWWWVGAGMGVGEVDELLRREEKRKVKRSARMAKRRMQRERAETLWKGVAGAIGLGRPQTSPSPERREQHASESGQAPLGTVLRRVVNHPPGRQVYGWFLHWRHAHLTAAREQAVERVERMNQVYGHEGGTLVGWGPGSVGLRQGREPRDDETVVASDSDSDSSKDVEKAKVADRSVHDRQGNVLAETGGVSHRAHRRRGRRSGNVAPDIPPAVAAQPLGVQPTSPWWWGPLKRWRLRDTTVY